MVCGILDRTRLVLLVGMLMFAWLVGVAPGMASIELSYDDETGQGTDTVFLWRVNRTGHVAALHNPPGFIHAGSGGRFEVVTDLPAPWYELLAVTPDPGSTEVQFVLTMYADRGLIWEDIVTDGGGEWLHVHIYIPDAGSVMPNTVRLGIEEEFNAWSWVGNVSSATVIRPGWNMVAFPLTEEMRHLRYFRAQRYISLTFSHVDDSGTVVPLGGTFYVDGVGLNGVYDPFS